MQDRLACRGSGGIVLDELCRVSRRCFSYLYSIKEDCGKIVSSLINLVPLDHNLPSTYTTLHDTIRLVDRQFDRSSCPLGQIAQDFTQGWYLRQISAGFYLHSKVRVSHRDVKSANVLLDRGCLDRIGNFGIARSLNDNHSGTIQALHARICIQSTSWAHKCTWRPSIKTASCRRKWTRLLSGSLSSRR